MKLTGGTLITVGALTALGFAAGAPALSGKLTTMGVSAKEKAAIIAWANANEQTFLKLSPAFLAAGNAVNARKISVLHTDCVKLKAVIRKVQHLPPIPDSSIASLFKESLSNLMAGTKACISGTAHGSVNASLLKTTGNDWKKGGNELVKVGHELAAAVS